MTAFNPHEYLNSFANFESKLHKLRPEDFDLGRIEKLLDLAGNPARDLKIVHVAGTKGKGSTCAFLASIVQKAGLKVGLYTSPHLHKVNERIRLLMPHKPSQDPFIGSISDGNLAEVLAFLRPFVASIQNEGYALTYFEVLTVASLVYFAREKADLVILETGLGGRLDATNAVDSLIAVITPISMDHMQILGPTMSQIAREKAGIIKSSHQKVVIAPQVREAMEVLLERCREFGVHPVSAYPEEYKNLKIGLIGRHQITNAACAIETVKLLNTAGFNISPEAIAEGIKDIHWAGRFEILKKQPEIIVDCAHNDASAMALSQTIKEYYDKRRIILVLAISQDKDIASICEQLKNVMSHCILTKSRHPRGHSFKEAEAKKYFGDKNYEIVENLEAAMDRAMTVAQAQDVILVAGSIFVVAEAREYLKRPPQPLVL